MAWSAGSPRRRPRALIAELKSAGAEVEDEPLKTHNWPLPYDELTNPLAINLTAAQHVHPDLLVGHDGPGLVRVSRRQETQRVGLSPGHGLDRQHLPEHSGLRILSVDGRPPLSPRHQRDRAFPAERELVRLLLLHHDRVSRGPRDRRRDLALRDLAPVVLRQRYSKDHYAPVELAGLYWHFVDLVWIILFTIVYLL